MRHLVGGRRSRDREHIIGARRCIVLSIIKVGVVGIQVPEHICYAPPLDLLSDHRESEILLAADELVVVVCAKVKHVFLVDTVEAVNV